MSEKLIQLHQELAENPYVTFNSKGNGESRVFDNEWYFHALNQNQKTIAFDHINENYRKDIQSYLYAVMKSQKEISGTHASVSSLIRYRNVLKNLAHRWGNSDFSLLSSEREFRRNY